MFFINLSFLDFLNGTKTDNGQLKASQASIFLTFLAHRTIGASKGAPGTPSFWTNCIYFHAVFRGNWANNSFIALVLVPLPWEILDPPLVIVRAPDLKLFAGN